MLTAHAALPAILERKGHVLLISSAAAFTVLPGMSAYCAAKAGLAGAVVAVAERRGSLASLRYAGVSRSVVALSVGVTLAAPLVIVALFGGINGYVVGTVFGTVLDGRSPGPVGGALSAGSVLLGVSIVLGCAVGAVMTAGARPEPQDARLG